MINDSSAESPLRFNNALSLKELLENEEKAICVKFLRTKSLPPKSQEAIAKCIIKQELKGNESKR